MRQWPQQFCSISAYFPRHNENVPPAKLTVNSDLIWLRWRFHIVLRRFAVLGTARARWPPGDSASRRPGRYIIKVFRQAKQIAVSTISGGKREQTGRMWDLFLASPTSIPTPTDLLFQYAGTWLGTHAECTQHIPTETATEDWSLTRVFLALSAADGSHKTRIVFFTNSLAWLSVISQ